VGDGFIMRRGFAHHARDYRRSGFKPICWRRRASKGVLRERSRNNQACSALNRLCSPIQVGLRIGLYRPGEVHRGFDVESSSCVAMRCVQAIMLPCKTNKTSARSPSGSYKIVEQTADATSPTRSAGCKAGRLELRSDVGADDPDLRDVLISVPDELRRVRTILRNILG